MVRDDWEARHFMPPGGVPADWRAQRGLVRVTLDRALPFVDITAEDTLAALSQTDWLMASLSSLGIATGDLTAVISSDRRVTRLISQWIADERDDDGKYVYSGIRYVSRLGADLECWAIFEGVALVEQETEPILTTNPELQDVAARYGLAIH